MDQIPIRPFLDLLTQGLAQPRPVARRVIAMNLGPGDRLALVGLAAALQGLLWAVVAIVAPGLAAGAFPGGLGIIGQIALFVLVLANYAITATAAFHIGKRFGGRGSAADVASAVAWHAALTAALTPLQAIAVGSGAALLVLIYAGVNIWLLAACVAEAHGFADTRRVMAATVGLFLGLGLVLSILIGMLGAG